MSLTCCGCVELRTGVLVLASLELVEAAVVILFSTILVTLDSCRAIEDNWLSDYDLYNFSRSYSSYDCATLSDAGYYVGVTGVVIWSLVALACISYIVGVIKDTPFAMLPLIFWDSFRAGIQIVLVVFLVYLSIAFSSTSGAIYLYITTAVMAVYTMINIYFIYVLELYFKLVRRNLINDAIAATGRDGNTTSVTVQQDVGASAPVPGYPAPVPGYPAPPPGYPAPPPGYAAPPPGYPASSPGYAAPPPGYAGYAAPPAGYAAPPAGYAAPPPGYTALNTGNGASAPGNGASVPGNAASAPGNGAPAPGNGASAPGNGASAPGNGASAPGNGASVPGNAASAPGNGAPAPGNGAPAPGKAAAPPGHAHPGASYSNPAFQSFGTGQPASGWPVLPGMKPGLAAPTQVGSYQQHQ